MLAITMKILTEKVGEMFDKLWFMAELIQNNAISSSSLISDPDLKCKSVK